ncbi:Mitochondrial carrier protein [Parasponia andersonii]|uniref:Mitochondrial carrier protein n=2 Tax=Magnoliopsida TaxID=3398 RepID=A0A2P5DDG4_PARAD|nr:Mitochondrial carrier protein [Parasponia andersonii]
MASEDVKQSESAVSTIVNLAEEAKLARARESVVKAPKPNYALLSICKSLVAGGVAGGVSRTAVAPLERLKILLQVQNPHNIKYNGTIQGLKYIWRTEGFRGLFKGNGTNCARIVPNSAVKFFSYEQASKAILLMYQQQTGNEDAQLTPVLRLGAGACAGIIAMSATYPMDMVRGRLTVQTDKSPYQYRGMFHALSTVLREEGPRALYKGWLPSVIGVVSNSYTLSLIRTQRKIHSFGSSHLIENQKATSSILIQPEPASPCFRSDALLDALQLFSKASGLSVVSATAIIGQFVRWSRHGEAVSLFSRMLASHIRPNEYTFGTLLPSLTSLRDIRIGKQFHACAIKIGLHNNVFVGSALLDLYAKLSKIEDARKAFEDTRFPNVVSYTTLICGYLKKERIEDAFQLFQSMPERNIVSWNAMIGGYSQTGHNEEALNLFVKLLREGLIPNDSTFPCAITAAANVAALGIGRSFHACAVKFLGKSDAFVGNSLVSFYAKCGSMEDSLLVFNKLGEKNIVSWNALICGYAQNGRGYEAISFFERMRVSGCQPNGVTILGLLWACNHAGLVNEGYSYFNKARLENPSLLKPEHYACMVDLLSRFGSLKQAEEFIRELSFDPGIGFWKALLGGCLIHSNMDLGELAAQKILALDPEDVSSYVMLSNAHSAAGRWQIVSKIRRVMKEKGVKRIPGCSWIEIRGKVHVFVRGDRNHPQKDEIYMVPYVGLNFAVYESLKDWLIKAKPFGLVDESETELSVITRLACGAAAGTVGQTVAYPLDVIRRRMQMVGWNNAASVVTGDGRSKAPLEYTGMIDAFRKTVRHEGFGALYKGLVPNSVKVVPSIAIAFVTYEMVKEILGVEIRISD